MNPRVPGLRELASARLALRRLAARAERHHTRYAGARLHWRRWGTGPALLLLHGGHGAWSHWVRNIEALAQHFSVWVPDMPGFGDSDALPGHPHAPDRQQHLIAALAQGLAELQADASDLHLAGFSFGGLVAAQLAVHLAQTGGARVHRLALLGVAGHGGARRQTVELLNWRQADGWALWQTHAINLERLMLHDPAQVDAQALVLHACASRATRYRSRTISRDAHLPDILARCDSELLLVWGEHDVTAVPQQIGPQLRDAGPGRRLCTVPGAGHWVQYEQAPLINSLLTDWFQSAPPSPLP